MTSLVVATGFLIPGLWAAWIVYWLIAARGAKRTRWREPIATHLLHGVPLTLCTILLVAPRWVPRALLAQVAPASAGLAVAGTLLLAAGLACAVWARLHLGRNWSGRVEVKEDHSLIRTGPYRLVRHPIYTGLLLAVAGTAVAIDEWRGVLAMVLALVGVLIRVGAEEREMRRTFSEYESYRAQTAALIPFVL